MSISRFQKQVSFLQKEFNGEVVIPDMKVWHAKIRHGIPYGAIYIIIHRYVDVAGSETDSYLLLSDDINWIDQKNDPEFRGFYFHQSKFDSNIWILKQDIRGHTNIISGLFKDPTKFYCP